ncbi:site-2 protease family protein [Candidatus Binatia bacterium]|nr:site-2 protease family protein [Candidatus Binatia bacterium]
MNPVSTEPPFRIYPPPERGSFGPHVASRRPATRGPAVNVVLFLLTLLTTSLAGAFQTGADPLEDPAQIVAGLPFALTLLSILAIHELGHYGLSKIHGVRASLPYFIPAPPILIGTFGAFIRMQAPPPNRRALFDVGAAGPWAGMIVAIPAVLVGLRLSEVRPLGLDDGGLLLGDSLLFQGLTWLALGTTPDTATIVLHPIALAGWFGLFVTFMNLLPVGQLDGGHVAYAMFGRWHRLVSRVFVGVIAALGFMGWQGWFVWVVLLLIIGFDHPPTRDAWTPLDWRRQVAAWLTVGVFVATFMAEPIAVAEPAQQFEGERIPVAWHMDRAPRPRGGLLVPFRVAARGRGIPL